MKTTIAASASQTASALDGNALRRLESRIGELVDQINAQPQAQAQPESGIAERIDALTQRIEQLAAEDAAQKLEERIGQLSRLIERNFDESRAPDYSDHLAAISRKIDGLGGNQTDALMERLEALSRQIGRIWDNSQAAGRKAAQERGNVFYMVPPAELDNWVKASAPLYDDWVADMNKRSLPGAQMLQDARALLGQYGKK